MIKRGHIDQINCKVIGGLKKKKKLIVRNGNFSYLLVPETMSPLHVQSEVCMAPFNVWSKVCIAPFQVRRKFVVFATHIEGSNADFAPHMEWGRCFRDQK